MLSKNELKLISSLKSKKYREKHGLFIVEGEKNIKEFLNSAYKLKGLYSTENVFADHADIISHKELKIISQLKTPNNCLAVFKIKETIDIDTTNLIVALDSIRDPGNLGTIIRLCDWFGVKDIICSEDTVDCYNPKAVQASMGSLTRVNVTYLNLKDFLEQVELPIYGTCMQGNSIYNYELEKNSVLILGGEAKGISDEIKTLVSDNLTIPRYDLDSKVESLNVATATAICLNEFRRK